MQQTQEWLKELCDTADLKNETEALSVFRVVMHQLRDRLAIDESVQFAAQLPTLLRGIYFESWVPSRVPVKKVRTQQNFFDQVSSKLKPRQLAPERTVKAVFSILAHHLDPGEISDVIANLPDDLKGLWPLDSRTYRERVR